MINYNKTYFARNVASIKLPQFWNKSRSNAAAALESFKCTATKKEQVPIVSSDISSTTTTTHNGDITLSSVCKEEQTTKCDDKPSSSSSPRDSNKILEEELNEEKNVKKEKEGNASEKDKDDSSIGLLSTNDFGESIKSRVYTQRGTWDTRLLGTLNENEFSTNIFFNNPQLPHKFIPTDALFDEQTRHENVIGHRIRVYCKELVPFYHVNDRLVTKITKDCGCEEPQELSIECIARFDYNLQSVVYGKKEDSDIYQSSVKLRVVRQKIKYNDAKIRATGAIEVPLTFGAIDTFMQMRGIEKREFCYWYVTIPWSKCDSEKGITEDVHYKFRVAFRRHVDNDSTILEEEVKILNDISNNNKKLNSDKLIVSNGNDDTNKKSDGHDAVFLKDGHSNQQDIQQWMAFKEARCECNIECEDDINLDTFAQLLKMLSQFYRYSYDTNEGKIYPLLYNYTEFEASEYAKDLTPRQLVALRNTKLLSCRCVNDSEADAVAQGEIIESSMVDFVRYLGLYTFAQRTNNDILSNKLNNLTVISNY